MTLPPNVKRIINYIRKSREEELQEEKTGIDALERQRLLMESVLNRYGIPFDQVKEIGSGDKIESRPVFRQVLKDLEEGKYQAIACRDIQRLGRGSYGDMGVIYDLLETKRIFIITEHRVYDPRNADDAKFIRMQLFISREEYFMIKERLVSARYFRAREEGKFMSSRPPYGYRVHPKTKKLEPYEEEAKVVRLIFRWFVEDGIGCRAICSRLQAMGVPTYTKGKHWRSSVVRKILKNPAYIGDIYFRTTETVHHRKIPRPQEEWIVHQGAHEPLIDKSLFDQAQRKFREKNSTPLPVKAQFLPSELAGMAWCGQCQRKFVRQSSVQRYRKQSGDISVYRKEFLYCGRCRISVKYRDVEELVVTMLDQLPAPDIPALQKALAETAEKMRARAGWEFNTKVLLHSKKKLEQQLDFIYHAYENGEYSKEQFQWRKRRVEEEMAAIESQLEAARRREERRLSADPLSSLPLPFTSWSDIYRSIRQRQNKNLILKQLFERIEIKVLEKGRGRKPSRLWIKGYLRIPFS